MSREHILFASHAARAVDLHLPGSRSEVCSWGVSAPELVVQSKSRSELILLNMQVSSDLQKFLHSYWTPQDFQDLGEDRHFVAVRHAK